MGKKVRKLNRSQWVRSRTNTKKRHIELALRHLIYNCLDLHEETTVFFMKLCGKYVSNYGLEAMYKLTDKLPSE